MNLDELNAINGSLYSDSDKSAAFSGIVFGSNGAPAPEGASIAFMAGYQAAIKWRSEAEEFQNRKSGAGKASAEARAARHGTAQPKSKQCSGDSRTVFGETSNQATSHKPQAVKEQSQEEHPAAPEPAAPEKVKTKSQSSTVREQELAQKLLDIWNSACDRAKLTRRSLPKCLKFPVDAMPAMKKYMKAYTDDEIIQLVTDGSRSVQKNDFYHERRYGFVNLMRNLGANANLSAPAERSADAPDGASPIPVAPSPKSSGLFDFDQDEAAAERKKLLDYEASLPVPEFPC